MKKWRKAVGAAVLLAAVAAVAGVTGGTASTSAAQKHVLVPAPDRRRPAVHRRPRRLRSESRPRRQARRQHAERDAQAPEAEEDVGQARRVGGRADPGRAPRSRRRRSSSRRIKVNVIIGEMASGATIPMAQSVAIPNRVVQISPTSSAPQITSIKDNGYLWRVYPSDTLQGRVLAQAAIGAFGKGEDGQRRRPQRRVRHRARSSSSSRSTRSSAARSARRLRGTRRRRTSTPRPAGSSSGNPAGYVIIDFPETFEKFAPSLVRTGKWERLEDADDGGDAERGRAEEARRSGRRAFAARRRPPRARPPARRSTRSGSASSRARSRTRASRARRFDAANLAFLAAVKACSAAGPKIKTQLRAVSGPPGTKVTYRKLDEAIKLLLAGKDIDYEGAWGPVDWDKNGDIGSAVFEIWKIRERRDQHAENDHLQAVVSGTSQGRRRLRAKPPPTPAPCGTGRTSRSAAPRRSPRAKYCTGDSYVQTPGRDPQGARRSGASSVQHHEDVVRTRLLLAPDCDWREAARAHRGGVRRGRAGEHDVLRRRVRFPRVRSSRSSSTRSSEPPR